MLNQVNWPEQKTLEWDILNPDLLINLEIKKKTRLSINTDIDHLKVPSSVQFMYIKHICSSRNLLIFSFIIKNELDIPEEI